MQEERVQILQMVQGGTITVEQAEQLLALLDDGAPAAPPELADLPQPVHVPPAAAPDRRRFRRYWEYPVAIGLILLGASWLCAASVSPPLLALCGWVFVAMAAVVVWVGIWSRWSPWVHVRVREQDGGRFAFSLPVPVSLLGVLVWPLKYIVRPFVDDDTAENINMVTSLLLMMRGLPSDEPIIIDVDEEDGDKVLVYIG
ncbi:MAG: hypothetical protein JW966_11500 [Anaerolineae bacterium]|nr:hypothetical protein [Anaerolineae bacterium]